MDSNAQNGRSLQEILGGQAAVDALKGTWSNTVAAGDDEVVPRGTYIAQAVAGELFKSKGGTPGFKIRFRISEGECTGRALFVDSWLTANALPMTLRDLAKFGYRELADLERPLRPGYLCELKVVQRESDDGVTRNSVRSFKILSVEEDPTVDADFASQVKEGVQ